MGRGGRQTPVFDNRAFVLVVADCDGLAETLEELRRNQFQTEWVQTATDAMARYRDFTIALIDLDLKDFDGLMLCRKIREESGIPLIGFTASALDRVLALEAGCDDCIDKPYSSRELVARIGALLRRSRLQAPSLVTNELSIHVSTREVWVGNRLVETTRKEFELLHLLTSEPGKLFSRGELLRRVWEHNTSDSEVSPLASRTIDTHVSSLRKKLGNPNWIMTIRGVGFRFNADTSTDPNGDRQPPTADNAADECRDLDGS